MANQQPHYSYRPVMNRNVTRKWAEARQVNYGGDDWGDDGYGGPSPDEQPMQQPLSYGQRSFTNPVVDTRNRTSFDREAENRNFSAGSGPASNMSNLNSSQAGPYNTAAGPRHLNQPQQPFYEQPQYPQTQPSDPPGRTSIDSFRRDAPRPESRESASGILHPPRKSSLGQNDFKDYSQPETLPTTAVQADNISAKPLPFIRPADIWKKHEEAEKERRSQESSTRGSMDSMRKDSGEKTSPPPVEIEQNRRRQPALDTVAERKSEYFDNLIDPTGHPEIKHEPSSATRTAGFPVAQPPASVPVSSRAVNEPNPVSAPVSATAPIAASTASHTAMAGRPALPQISRTSTFGPDFLYSAIPTNRSETHEPTQIPGTRLPGTAAPPDLQHAPSQPYRSIVRNAFESENIRRDDSPTTDSLLRTNTASTSDISPIVATPTSDAFDRTNRGTISRTHDLARPPAGQASNEEVFNPPRRVNTNRRDSPSPARRPLSLVAPAVPEPLSAVTSPEEHTPAPDTARAAQVMRPGLANLIHQRGPSKDLITNERALDTKPQTQGSMDSDTSALSNERTTSEEWASWNAARSEAHARHGIPDSKPSTPGFASSVTSTPAPAFDSLNHNVHLPSGAGETGTRGAVPAAFSSQRPQVARDESFRPSLPGGWMSSSSIQKTEVPEPVPSQVRPPLAQSVESTESIPTATAPRDTNWRSQYRAGSQGGALAAATAAGAAMAGIFNGPSLTLSSRPESDVSSMTEADEGPTGLHRDASMKTRDFAASPQPPQHPTQSASHDFAAMSPSVKQATPKGSQAPLTKVPEREKPTLALPGQAAYSLPLDTGAHDSPTKESEWWDSSEDEAKRAPAPAPLRTNRLSTIEPSHASISPVSRLTDTDPERLESDIVKSLTPKSSHANTADAHPVGSSPTQHRHDEKSVSPPFAAAALAVSPGRDYRALEEQNAFHPLTAPSSKTISPLSQKTGQTTMNMPPIPPTFSDTQPSPIIPKSHVAPPPVTLPTSTSQERTSEAPSLPAFDAAKVGSTDVRAPRSESKTVSDTFIRDNKSSALDSRNDRSISTQPISSDSGSGVPLTPAKLGSPAVAQFHGANTVNEAVTMPTSKAPATNDLTRDQPITPAKNSSKSIDTATKPVIRQPSLARSEVSAMSVPTTPIIPRTAAGTRNYDPSRAFPSDKFSGEQINNMQSPAQRINAYNENRTAYAEPMGHLENWLTHMNTPDRAEAFAMKPMDTTPYASTDRFDKRDSSAPSSTTKSVDGKRMLASASKMGQKAGVLGKGLFSKGKEKLRTVSASQKGSVASQSTDRIVPDTRQPSISSVSRAPQLPEPSVATPLEESSLSAYFAGRDEPTTATTTSRSGRDEPITSAPVNQSGREEPATTADTNRSVGKTADGLPFSLTSGSSSNQIGQQRTPDRNSSTAIAQPGKDSTAVSTDPKSAPNRSHEAAGLLKADATRHNRRDSSVSDVSSISDPLVRNQSVATRTISPQINPESVHDISAPPTRNISTTVPARERQSRDAATLATDMAATSFAVKEAEARRDRVDEQTLPAYEQARPHQSKVAQGAQIIPIARISQNHEQGATNSSRPFSFIGNESLSKTGYPKNQSIDNPGVSTGVSGTRGSIGIPPGGQISQQADYQAGNPLPSARRNPEEYAAHAGRTPEEFAILRQNAPAIQTRPEEPSAFRIPGPYGQELRSPKPKSSSPMLEQSRTDATAIPQGESYEKGFMPTNVSATAPYDERNRMGEQNFPAQNYDNQGRPIVATAFPTHPHQDSNRPGEQNFPTQYQQEPGVDAGLRHQRSLATSLAEHEREQAEERRERSRTSKFTSMFRPRSRSQSRRLREERAGGRNYTEQRPANSKRNSLIQTNSRNSIPHAQSQSISQAPSWYNDEVQGHDPQSNGRPLAGSRRLSKDLFKNAQYGQQGLSQPHYDEQGQQQQLQPLPAASGKKKRFSGLFGRTKTSEQVPTRTQTMPMDSGPQQRLPPQQQFEPSHGYQHQPQQQYQAAQGPQPQIHHQQQQQAYMPFGYHRQTTMSHDHVSQQPLEQDRRDPLQQSSLGQQFQGTQGPAEGYYGGRSDDLNRQSSQVHYNQSGLDQRPTGSTAPDGVLQQNTSYQDHRNDQYGLGHQQGRPNLPHLDTSERAAPVSHPLTAPYGSSTQQTMSQRSSYEPQIYSAPGRAGTVDQAQFQPPSTRANKDISYGSDFSRANTAADTPVSAPPIPPQVQSPLTSTVDSGSKITPRVAALHTRSRSPKLGRRDSSDLNEEFSAIQNSNSPVAGLGTFQNKKVSPMGGVARHDEEQEKPFLVSLPGMQNQRDSIQDDPNSATSTKAREMRRIMLERNTGDEGIATQQSPAGQTVADRFMGIPASAPQQSKQSSITSPVSSPTRNVMLSKNPSLRGREPVNRSTSTTPVNSHIGTNGGSILSSPTNRSATLTSQPPVPPISAAKAVKAPVSAPPVPKTIAPVAPPTRALTPPQPAISPPPPPASKAAAPTTTNEAGITKMLPAPRAGKVIEMHELPGSKPDGYESEEEVVMSATAFPGQEWMPVFDRWED